MVIGEVVHDVGPVVGKAVHCTVAGAVVVRCMVSCAAPDAGIGDGGIGDTVTDGIAWAVAEVDVDCGNAVKFRIFVSVLHHCPSTMGCLGAVIACRNVGGLVVGGVDGRTVPG